MGLLNHASTLSVAFNKDLVPFSSYIYMHVSVWVYVHRVPAGAWRGQSIGFLGAGATGSCESPDTGAGN